jgi:hypothetical protein
VREPEVDPTARLRPYTTAGGIDMPDAEAPPGEYVLKVRVGDRAGRFTETRFRLQVVGR